MNLFESQLSKLTTEDNAIYMEAVAQMFDVLFEAEAAQEKFKFDDRRALLAIVMPAVNAAKDIWRNDYLATFAGGNDPTTSPAGIISKLSERVEDKTISDAEFYKQIVAACDKLIDFGTPTDSKSFFDGFKKFVTDSSTPELAKELQQSMFTYLSSIQKLQKGLAEFKATTGAEMAKRRRTERPRHKAWSPSMDNGLITVGPGNTEIGEKKRTVKASPKVTKPSTKEEKPAEEEEDKPIDPKTVACSAIIEGNGDSDARIMFNLDPTEANSAVEYIKDAWDTLVRARHRKGLDFEPITISADPEGKVTIEYTQSGGDMNKISMYRVAMYCLYCDLLRKDSPVKLDPATANSTMTESVARSIVHDRTRHPSMLSQLFPQYLEAFGSQKLSADEIDSSVVGLVDNNEIDKYIREALHNFGREGAVPNGNSDAENKDEFDKNIAGTALGMYTDALEESGLATLGNESAIPPENFIDRVENFTDPEGNSLYDIFKNLYEAKADKFDVTMTMYNEDASQVVSACRSHFENKNDLHYIPVSPKASAPNQYKSIMTGLAPARATR